MSSPWGPMRYGCRRTSCELPRNFSTPTARTVAPSSSQRKSRISPRARLRSADSTSSNGDSTVSNEVVRRFERKRRNAWAPDIGSIPFMQKYWSAVSESITTRTYPRRWTSVRSSCSRAEIVTSTLVNSGVLRISAGTFPNGTTSRTDEMSLNGMCS